MADTKEGQKAQGVQAGGAFKGKNQTLTLIGVITGHVPVHLYGQGFLLILPYLSSTLLLYATIQAGLHLETIRRAGGGVASIGGGVVTDRYQHLRGHFLGAQPGAHGPGNLVAGARTHGEPGGLRVPACWPWGLPPPWGLLAPAGGQRPVPAFPGAAWHGHLAPPTSGTVGDTMMPYPSSACCCSSHRGRRCYQSRATFLTLAIALPLWAYLWNVGGPKVQTAEGKERGFGAQIGDFGKLLREAGCAADGSGRARHRRPCAHRT